MARLVQSVLPGLELDASPLVLRLAAEAGIAALLYWMRLPRHAWRPCPCCGLGGRWGSVPHAVGCPAPMLIEWLAEHVPDEHS